MCVWIWMCTYAHTNKPGTPTRSVKTYTFMRREKSRLFIFPKYRFVTSAMYVHLYHNTFKQLFSTFI